jgi:hypothetical protein
VIDITEDYGYTFGLNPFGYCVLKSDLHIATLTVKNTPDAISTVGSPKGSYQFGHLRGHATAIGGG